MSKYQPIDDKTLQGYNAVREADKRTLLCHAPSKSMRFAHSGNALACCYNREVKLGRYPEVSVHDMWFSEKRQQLIDHLAHNDMNMGCQDCKHMLYDESYYASGARKYDYLPERVSDYPVMLDFEISNVCNLECVMCNGEYSSSIRKNREKKPPYISPYDIEFARQLEEFIPHLYQAKFAGGEPFLIDLHYEIWDRIIAINPMVEMSVQTNGTVLKNKVRTLLDKGNFRINISIDALDKTNYESIRVNADHAKVMANVEELVKYMHDRGKVMEFDVCLMRNNWWEIPDFIRYCNERNIQLNFHIVDWPLNLSLRTLPANELSKIHSALSTHQFIASGTVQQSNIDYFNSLLMKIKGWQQAAEKAAKDSSHIKSREEIMASLQLKLEGEISRLPDVDIQTKSEKINYYNQRLQDIFSAVKADRERLLAMDAFDQMPINMVVSELDISDNERMLSKIDVLLHNKEKSF